MSKLKLITVIVVLLAAVNIALLIMLWTNRGMGRPPLPGGNARDYLVKELTLTPEQTKQYDSLRQQHHEAVLKIQQQERQYKEAFFATLNRPAADSAYVDSMTAKVATASALRDKITYYHFREVRALLLPKQQQKFDAVIQEALRMMDPASRPPGLPDGDRPPPGEGPGRQPPPQ